MKSNTSLKSFVLGFVLAALLLPAPGYAQWTVFDPANYTFQVSKKLEEFNRWLETVQQYTQMYENAVGQLTNLQGILRTVDDALAHERQMRRFLSYWGQAVRLVFRVKNQLVNLVTGAARAVLNIAQRLKNGIFDPAADKRDFAEYLRYGIGRTAQDTEAEFERLKKMDNQLERLEYDHQREAEQLAELAAHIKVKQEELERLKNCEDCTDKDRDMEQLSFELTMAKPPARTRRTNGTGSIVYRGKGKNRRAYLRIRYVDEITGKIKEKFERVTSKTEANEKAHELRQELKTGGQKLFDGDRLTFREVAEEYIKRHVTEAQYVGERKVKGLRSWEDTRSKILVLAEHFNHQRIRSITYNDLLEYRTARLVAPVLVKYKENGGEKTRSGRNRAALQA